MTEIADYETAMLWRISRNCIRSAMRPMLVRKEPAAAALADW